MPKYILRGVNVRTKEIGGKLYQRIVGKMRMRIPEKERRS